MIGQNSFSNSNTNPNGSVFSAAPTINQNISSTPEKKIKKPGNTKTIIIAVIAALAGAGIATAIVLLVTNRSTQAEGETTEIQYASPDNDGTQEVQETLEEFDKEISAAKTDDERLSLTINKAGFYQLNEDYDAALRLLNSIDINSLNDFDQYRVYNTYAGIYQSINDDANYEKYKNLADEANARDFNNS
ncbi:hypothetical protein IKG31_02875 [Candidatus Saccharibacteria bacterium]|nr:hypothetical protein [Candidatus Saccharibacteria bacterium]